MPELTIARHGEAFCNVLGIVGGARGCTGLTDRGRSQASQLGHRLADEQKTRRIRIRLFASPRRRAAETVNAIARHLSEPVEFLDDLRDPDYGASADGQSWSELISQLDIHPSLNPTMPLVSDGESWAIYVPRVTRTIKRLTSAYPDDHIVIIGHGETVRAAWHHFSELPADDPTPFKLTVDNASLTSWRTIAGVSPTRWELVRHNDSCHTAIPVNGVLVSPVKTRTNDATGE